MEIKKVTKRNGSELILDWYYKDGEINPEIKTMDKVTFLCERCNEETTKQRVNIGKDALCANCQRKKSNLEKYGVEHLLQDKSKVEKAKQTNLKRYGNANYNNREKAIKTNIEKYGVENISQLDEVKEKKVETFKKHYGKKHYFETEEFTKNFKNKYGVVNQFQREDVKNKIKQTNLKKHNVSYFSQSEEWKKKTRETKIKNNFNLLKIFKQENINPLFTIENYYGAEINNKYSFQCNTCNTIFEDHLDDGRIPRCPTCFPLNRSKGEIELANFLNQYIEIIENDRELIKPKEIDILIPSLNLAIEYNGEYWHNDINREEEKSQLIEEAGYDLIVIWESDWNENKEEIKEDLLNLVKIKL